MSSSVLDRRNMFIITAEEKVERTSAANGVFDTIMKSPLGRWVVDGPKAMSALDQKSIDRVIDEVDCLRDDLGHLVWKEIREDLKMALEDFVLVMRSLNWSTDHEVIRALADLSVSTIERVIDRLIECQESDAFLGAQSEDFWSSVEDDDEACCEVEDFADSVED